MRLRLHGWLLACSICVLAACGGGGGKSLNQAVAILPHPDTARVAQSHCSTEALVQGLYQVVDGHCVRSSPALGKNSLHGNSAAVARLVSINELFNWAEVQYPQYFWPATGNNQYFEPYTYRYYAGTQTYLGVAGEHIFIMGPHTGGAISHVGAFADYACVAMPQRCSVPGSPKLVSAGAGNAALVLNFEPPQANGGQTPSSYTASCQAAGAGTQSATAASSPIVVANLINGLLYSCNVVATNSMGSGPNSNAFSATPIASAQQLTSIALQSELGDSIGAGGTYAYTRKNANISVSVSAGRMSVVVDGDEKWWGEFALPSGQSAFEAGATYTNLQRYPFHVVAQGGLSWWGEGRGCNALDGGFKVVQATYQNGAANHIVLEFDQHCESASPRLHGRVEWYSSDTTVADGPVDPAPVGLWAPTPAQVPASGNYVFLQSDSSDYIGAGQNLTYGAAAITATSNGGLVSINVSHNTDAWSGNFMAMDAVSPLRRGYYAALMRYPFHNPAKGGLSWSGMGRGCNQLTGWFVVDDVAYTNGTLSLLKLRFEQHCEGASAALRGQINWAQ